MAVVDTRNKWPLGRAIKICFLDGLSDTHAMVEEAAREWERCVNLRFEFGHPEWNSDVRISFHPIHARHGIGSSWSGFGTDALTSSYACNMYLDVQYRALTRGTVLHEFGHLLAFDHEHQSPKSIIQWNKTAVAMELRHRTSRFLEDNYFHTFQGPDIECTAFDPNSIMMYGIPARWTLNWQTYHNPTVLSELDKSFAAQQYPFPPPSQPTPPPQQVALPRVWEVACYCGDTLSQPYNFRQRRVCRCQQSVKA
ncbi:uncharacterized protein PODANS_5_10780 [Podospora anserina S mat+]|uniref:Podospora anserina S mat+ genomic DNA chromosome 5, supercontig 10 n=1 Tax=Podospora anserina (strain S / ATCC MYA-4624 / DSM 980 / FGSC 10383) TaxID=515849 RepID=B2APF2_PODAN|nr:uncharacterized protein PODANS_5_10780 [Podospora anserina S mat+]CAP65869.1 unnamed protein product [Podospora anserina S mat+]CDP30269.1 Putative protein of unknown function [Podospora anserina S mat+]